MKCNYIIFKMKIKIFLFLILFFTFSYSFKCGHDELKTIPPKIVNNSINKDNNNRRLDTYHPISFYVDYSHFDTLKLFTKNDKILPFYKEAINSTLEIFSKLIKVKRKGNIKIPSDYGTCSSKISTYNSQLVRGVDNDVILITIIDDTLTSAAAASVCYLDEEDKRPIMGYVLLGSDYSITSKNAKEYLIMLLLHEISHILVFSKNLYQYYRYKGDVTITKIINGVSRTLIATPKVKNIASQHFNCSSIEGIELENHGGKGTVGSHWEGRVMLGDFMISTDHPENVISDITLALFEDSGWYEVNYYTGGLFRFGKDQGCEFLNTTCLTSGKSNFEWEFCDKDDEKICSSNNLNRGYCYIKNYDYELESYYQYFDDKKMGGLEYIEFCPAAKNYYSEDYFAYNCVYGEKNKNEELYPTSLGFSISENSICIQSSLVKSSDSTLTIYNGRKRTMCHEISCDYENETFTVNIGDSTIECPTEGGEMEVEGYNGTIKCPPYNRVCTSEIYTGDPIKAVLNEITNSDLDYSFKYIPEDNEDSKEEEDCKDCEELEEHEDSEEREKREEREEREELEDSEDINSFIINDNNNVKFLFVSLLKYLLILIFLY